MTGKTHEPGRGMLTSRAERQLRALGQCDQILCRRIHTRPDSEAFCG
jgi:hypothetical protein